MIEWNPGKLALNTTYNNQGFWECEPLGTISYTENGHELIREHEASSFWFEHRLKCLLTVVKDYDIKMVLDIGGGNGEFSKYLQLNSIQTILLEPGKKGVDNAISKGIKNIINSSLFEAGFIDAGFPAVCLLDVLEHIEDDENFLLEIKRILKPGGKLIITVPAYQWLYSRFDTMAGHYRRYNLTFLSRKLERIGFKINYKTYFFSFLPMLIFIRRILISWFHSKAHKSSGGHFGKSSITGRLLNTFLLPEQFCIEKKMKIPFGSSCLLVAHKSIV